MDAAGVWECGRRYSGWVLRSLEFGANAGASEWLNVGGISNQVCSKPAPPGYEQRLESGGRGNALFTQDTLSEFNRTSDVTLQRT